MSPFERNVYLVIAAVAIAMTFIVKLLGHDVGDLATLSALYLICHEIRQLRGDQ